jgi:hypothetical protein
VELGFSGGANDMASVDVRPRAEHYDSNPRRRFGPKQFAHIDLRSSVERTEAEKVFNADSPRRGGVPAEG